MMMIDTIVLTITNTPSITIPSNVISWCSDNLPLIISGVSASNYTTIEWSTDGTGTFNNNNVLNPNYNPSSQDLITGVNLSVSVANGTNCPTVSETINVIFEENVSVSAGDDGIICENDTFPITNANTTASNFTWSSSGDGTFINDTTLSPIYTPGPSDINSGIPVVITLTADNNNACPGSTSDSLLLNITREATSIAGPATDTICAGDVYPLNGVVGNFISVEWTTSGDGVFGNNGRPHSTTYTPGPNDLVNGLVTLSLQAVGDAPCNNLAVSSIDLFINGEITVFAGADAFICESDNFYLISDASITPPDYTSLAWTTSGTGFFDDPFSLNPIYNPSPADINAGVVTLTLDVTTAGGCVINPDSLILTITKEATSNAGPTTDAICEGAIYTLNGVVDNSISEEWTTSGDGVFGDDEDPNTTYTPGPNDITNGLVTLSLQAVGDAPCNNLAISSIDLFINGEITVFAGDDAAICESTSFYQLSAAAITPPNYTSFEWITSGTGFFTDPLALNPVYSPSSQDLLNGFVQLTLEVATVGGCGIISDDIVLEFIEEVSGTGIIAGLNAVCLNTVNTYTVTGLNDVDSYTWSINPPANAQIISGDGTDSVVVESSLLGFYDLTVIPSNSCGSGDPVTLNIEVIDFNLALISALGTDSQVLCETEPLAPIEYEFSAGATSATVSTLPAGVTSAIVGNVLTISGTPSAGVTTTAVYPYTVTTVGGSCPNTTLSGTITVDPEVV